MHNISSGGNDGVVLETTFAVGMNHAHSERVIVGDFRQLGVHVDLLTGVQVGQHSWDWGIDITWGTRKYGPVPAVPNLSFEKVDDDFEYEEGMAIAIAVYLDEEPSQAENVAPSDATVAAEQFHTTHGPANRVNVYTGKITAVGDDYIAYNINTFKGFLSALVFLTDGAEQSASVAPEDLGKVVIAVHAGYSEGGKFEHWIHDWKVEPSHPNVSEYTLNLWSRVKPINSVIDRKIA
jgi:hypothetical protein